jgi:hypothetical protein
MAIVAGFNVHRAQITFDALHTETGEVTRGRIDSTPAAIGRWAARFRGRAIDVAVEACTGWLFVCDALAAAGATARGAAAHPTDSCHGYGGRLQRGAVAGNAAAPLTLSEARVTPERPVPGLLRVHGAARPGPRPGPGTPRTRGRPRGRVDAICE